MIHFPSLRHMASATLIAICLVLGALTMAQSKDQTTEQTANLAESLIARLDQIEATLNRESLSDKAFNDLRAELVIIEQNALTQKNLLQPSLDEAKARIEALKPAQAKEGEEVNPEAEVLISRRAELEEQIAETDAQVKLINSSLLRARQLSNKITVARQDRFTKQLFDRSGTLFNPALWLSGLSGLIAAWKTLNFLMSDWASFLATKAADRFWQISAMITFVAIIIFGPLRYLLFSSLRKLARLEAPTLLQRSLHACWALVSYTFIPVAILIAVVLILSNADLLPTRIELLADQISFVIFSVSLGYGLIRVLLAPNKSNYRLLNFETSTARKLYGIALALLSVYAIDTLFDQTSETLLIPLETTILIRGVAAILIAILVWMGMRMIIAAKSTQDTTATKDGPAHQGFSLPGFVKLLQPLVWLACIVIAIAPVLGYVSLGSFLAVQMGRAFIILALLGIFSALVDNFLSENLETEDSNTQKLSRAFGIAPRAIAQIGVLSNGLLRILLYVSAALLIFAPWGVESTDFLTAMQQALFNIQIGDLSISPINILGALVVFIVTLVLVKSIQGWMEKRLMPATNMDTGLKNSIQTSVGYVGFIIAAMLAFSYMGVNLSNIALVAGALSVGIGFGLQSIVNNFVSGLILLVERPIKTGDWVVVGADQGYVKKISVRATKIETFDRATVIVPNSDLISNRVMNWMHNGSLGRIIVPVGVAYDADPEQVREILLKVAQDSDLVTSYPMASVYFMDFGASSLDFELRCYVQDINNSLSAKSALRFAIFKALKDANIEIPFPQQDVYVRSIATPEKQQESTIQPFNPDIKETANKTTSDTLKAEEIELADASELTDTTGDTEGDADIV